MSDIQPYLAENTRKVSADLAAAFRRLPADKAAWSPAPSARDALDMVAECGVIHAYTAEVLENRAWPAHGFGRYREEIDALVAQGADAALARLEQVTERVTTAILALPDELLAREIDTSFGAMTLLRLASYPYWNMSYHEGQINYVASILGCLP